MRERKPLVHQITNYVVMNETANATLALGALPVMAHAREEVEEMAQIASALVINIGTLSEHWVESMLLAGKAASARPIPVVLDPVGAGATSYRTETARAILDAVDVTVLRGNPGEVATLVGAAAEVRGVESISTGSKPAELAREAARQLGAIASVTGPVDYVSDGERVLAVSNGDALLATVTGTGCMSSALTGCFLAAKPDSPLEAAAEALAAFGVAAEDAAAGAAGPGTFHARRFGRAHRHGARARRAGARTHRRRSGRRARRHRAARRCGRCVPSRAARSPAAAPRRGPTSRNRRARDARRLRWARPRRAPHRRALGLPARHRPRPRPAGGGRDARRPRVRRGLRAARRHARSARLHGHRPLRGRVRRQRAAARLGALLNGGAE